MNTEIITSFGTVRIGTTIRIDHVKDDTPYLPGGIDYHARELNGKEGTVTHIDDAGQLFGTWGGLAIIPEVDEFTII